MKNRREQAEEKRIEDIIWIYWYHSKAKRIYHGKVVVQAETACRNENKCLRFYKNKIQLNKIYKKA
ncbi:MAG: hypothetical protein J6J86_05560, partial [Lachnospiraceae bacterium]|nr:hypothetical protein [Lachnospiraceae bacterium]